MRAGSLQVDARQHQAHVAFARDYVATPAPPRSARRRVLVSGFGPFPPHAINATTDLVAALADVAGVAGVAPLRDRDGELVELRTVVVPVLWDVAPIVLVREIEAFRPDLILMNGIARDEQPIWLERGARNVRSLRDDASGTARPAERELVVVHEGAPERRLDFPVDDVVAAAAIALEREVVATPALAAVAPSVVAIEPRDDNGFLCNQVTYVVDHALAHGGETLSMLRCGGDESVLLMLPTGLAHVPRAFVHWPARIGAHVAAGGRILRVMVETALGTAECAPALMR